MSVCICLYMYLCLSVCLSDSCLCVCTVVNHLVVCKSQKIGIFQQCASSWWCLTSANFKHGSSAQRLCNCCRGLSMVFLCILFGWTRLCQLYSVAFSNLCMTVYGQTELTDWLTGCVMMNVSTDLTFWSQSDLSDHPRCQSAFTHISLVNGKNC